LRDGTMLDAKVFVTPGEMEDCDFITRLASVI
jgi:hypothetical protein